MYVRDDDDPAFNGANGSSAGLRARIAGLGVGRGLLRLISLVGLVDIHFCVGHVCGGNGWCCRGVELRAQSVCGVGAGVWCSLENLPLLPKLASVGWPFREQLALVR